MKAKHNNTNYDLSFPESATMQDLCGKVAELTGVSIPGQKLICCGKQLPKDMTVSLKEAGFSTGVGSRIMILGKKFEAESDADYKVIIQVENKAKDMEEKSEEISIQIENVYKSKLDKHLYAEAKSLQKSLKNMNENLQKQFEFLDSLTLNEDQQECKVRRKAVATKLNQLMDRNDAVLEKMNQWIKDKLA